MVSDSQAIDMFTFYFSRFYGSAGKLTCNNKSIPFSSFEDDILVGWLKSSLSCGSDEISNRLLKLVNRLIAKPLYYIINLSYQTGVFPCRLEADATVETGSPK
uniref:Uncharacterized protein n=1 Tax=Photinus pyralis TaxID=7054 RepID=A0A1Y1MUJ5_PHOPY